jgi:hypothetical protein
MDKCVRRAGADKALHLTAGLIAVCKAPVPRTGRLAVGRSAVSILCPFFCQTVTFAAYPCLTATIAICSNCLRGARLGVFLGDS